VATQTVEEMLATRPVSWLETYLEPDELTFADIEKKYGVRADRVAEANGVPYTSAAINTWIKQVGGRQLASGAWVFRPDNVIQLPGETVAQYLAKVGVPPGTKGGAQVQQAGMPSWMTFLIWTGVGYAAYSWLKGGKRRSE
jgi:hypothetical protein